MTARPLPGRRAALGLMALVLGAAFVAPAAAANYPTRTITVIVPFSAGGPSDVLARLLAGVMATDLGQTIVVENVGGAGGNVGAARAAHAAPDGYTLLSTNTSMAVSPALYRHLDYDPAKDFADIGFISFGPSLLFARRDFPPGDFKSFVAYLKAQGQKISFGTTGPGGPSDLCSRLFMQATGTKFTIVPYKGTSQAMNDLIAGRLDVMCDSVATAVPQVKAGNAKAYAVEGTARLPALPQTPTLPEEGVATMGSSVWTALYAPKGTPQPVIDRLVASLHHALADASFRQRAVTMGQVVATDQQASPAALHAELTADIAKWGRLLKSVAAGNN